MFQISITCLPLRPKIFTAMNTQLLEWIGYAASVIVALSMLMTSIVKFRWINFVGAGLFSLYGFLIGSLPVGILNGIVALTDLYYLFSFYSRRDVFEVLEVTPKNRFLQRFLNYYEHDIHRFVPNFHYDPSTQSISYLVLRNMAVAGVFVAKQIDDHTIEVELDYVIREYRDFKNGKFVYYWLGQNLVNQGFTTVYAHGGNQQYLKYLKMLGFKKVNDSRFVKYLGK